ncbi:zinc finger protein 320-like [Aphis craccivora]|uniref:Zinc finger protein 320-like n=1 Tax=Aphis craccivora TaxID=307492 RepID=A0A6G0YQD3_APHCR|nr:zinc finger protein 320-like [Aphis craccivora]
MCEGTFICNYCPKIFHRKDALKDHSFYHFGRQNFECSLCNKMFSDKRNLNSHIKIKHVGFTVPSMLSKHRNKMNFLKHDVVAFQHLETTYIHTMLRLG